MKKIFTLFFLSVFVLCNFVLPVLCKNFGDEFGEDDFDFGEGRKYTYGMALSGHVGISAPNVGYDNYRTNPTGGGEIKLLFRRKGGVPYSCSFGIDFIPLALPKNTTGDFSEDIITAGLNATVNYYRFTRIVPFAGLGGGYYWHTLSQDIPNFGSKTDTKNFFGFSAHTGVEFKITPYISCAPHYKIHFISQPGVYATIAVYSVNAILYFGERLGYYEK